MKTRLSVFLAVVAGSMVMGGGAASAAIPCSGQLPNGGYYDLGTTCHNSWAVVDREVDEVIVLANQLIDNTEQFANELVTVVCGTVSCP